jgi:biotin-(acetyl-CoA carboxylase) ligase
MLVGLGVNVRNPIPPELQSKAIAIGTWDPTLDAGTLAAPVAAAVALAAREAGPLSAAELRAYALRDVLEGARVSAPVTGTAAGITSAGALRIRTDTGPLREILGGVVALPS